MKKYYFVEDDGNRSLMEFNTLEKAKAFQEKSQLWKGCKIAVREQKSMTLGEFITKYSGDIDVYDDYDESLGIAFCGGDVALTDEGEKHFADVMGLDVELYTSCAVVNVNDLIDPDLDPDVDPDDPIFAKVKELFYTFAGYCPEENYNKYVKEVWRDMTV